MKCLATFTFLTCVGGVSELNALEIRPVVHFSASPSQINPGGFESLGSYYPTFTEYFVEYPVYLLPPVTEAYLRFDLTTGYDSRYENARVRTSISTYDGDGLSSTAKVGIGDLWGQFDTPVGAGTVRPSDHLLDVTSVIRSMQQADVTFAGFRFHQPILLGNLQQVFVYGPGRVGSPVLFVNEVPEPSALALLVVGQLSWFLVLSLLPHRDRRFARYSIFVWERHGSSKPFSHMILRIAAP